MKRYLLIAQTCINCGSNMMAQAFDELPSEFDKDQITNSLGGHWCISTTTLELNDEGIYES